MIYENQIKDDEIIVFADTSLYSKDSIFKCLYWYGNNFHTNISITQESRREFYKITLKPLVGYEIDEQTKIKTLQKLENDLVDLTKIITGDFNINDGENKDFSIVTRWEDFDNIKVYIARYFYILYK